MEFSSWPESSAINRIKAIQELTQGQILTDWLQEMIGQPEKVESNLELFDDALAQIIGVFGNTVSVFKSSSNFNNISFNQTHDMTSPNDCDDNMLKDTKYVKAMMPLKVRRGCYKRSKNTMIHTTVTFNLVNDGYAWRKYGQKEIINSEHPRQYYRCTHKYEQGCKATKQVQMIDDEPSKYMITYHRHHTCSNSQTPCHIILDSPSPKENSVLISFDTNPLIKKKQVSGFSPSLTTQKPNNRFPSLIFSSDCYTTWDPFTQSSKVPLEPLSMMSYGLDMSTSGYEIDDMILIDNFGVPFSKLCS
ncbi:hypothetical protein SSX86_010407 [Deinandra increscens subsp. villosa]|uniref:WRKY domain-containing protein n=1 Tax=Deinandra increscens subsp. villosa TaxID=3103831 RepID=A0AAP0D7X6_9ASTR